MSSKTKRILTMIVLVSPIFIAGILTKNITLDILPIGIVAVFSFWVAIRSKHNMREKQ